MTVLVGLPLALLLVAVILCVGLRRPHRVDNPVQNRYPDLPPEWGTMAAALERIPAGVRAEFAPAPEPEVLPAGGVLLVPDGVDLPPGLPAGATVLRVPRAAAGRIRFARGGYVSSGEPVVLPPVRRGPAPGGRRYRNAGLAPLRTQTRIPDPPPRTGSASMGWRPPPPKGPGAASPLPEPTVPPVGGSGCSDAVALERRRDLAGLLARNRVLERTVTKLAAEIEADARRRVPRSTGRFVSNSSPPDDPFQGLPTRRSGG